MAISSSKSCHVYVFIGDPYVVVSGSQVDIQKDVFTFDLIEQVIDPRKWVTVFYGHLVEMWVIDAHSHHRIFFI